MKELKEISGYEKLLVGGKAASLGRMMRVGLPVPAGYVIFSSVFEKFLSGGKLKRILKKINIEDTSAVEKVSQEIKSLLHQRPISGVIKKEILKSFKKLNSNFVAVRSSATLEDSGQAAWAGQMDSFLNTTEENLLENIKKCWISLFNPRAIRYRFQQGVKNEEISMAVVIQSMVESSKSGVAFSAHPISGNRDQIMIEAGFGLGEAIVSGSVTPDNYVVDKKLLKILEIQKNDQQKALFRAKEGGNQWKNLQKKHSLQVLSNLEIIELSELVVKVEQCFGYPCDIEWAKEKEKFYIVQARPITVFATPEPDKTESFRRSDYVLEFEAEGLKPLFQELMLKNYYPRKTLMIFEKNILKSLIPHDIWNEIGDRGMQLLAQPGNSFYTDMARNIKRNLQAALALNKSKKLTREGLRKMLRVLEEAAESYGYFNVGYIEKAHKNKDKSKIVSENLQKIEKSKNSVKEEFNKIFFFPGSCWEKFIQKIVKQFPHLKQEEIEWYLWEEIELLFEGKNVEKKLLAERKKAYVFIQRSGKAEFYQGGLAKKMIAFFEQGSQRTKSEISGLVANSGANVIGKVKIINVNYENFNATKKKIEAMKSGEILVSRTTDPSLMEACLKASAIITDVGGMLSHAAITARELGIPCIVGTQFASKFLKNGNTVEVDSKNGIVKILK